MFIKYYFKIEHVKKSDNNKADAFSGKKKLQSNNKILRALLKLKKKWKDSIQSLSTSKNI